MAFGRFEELSKHWLRKIGKSQRTEDRLFNLPPSNRAVTNKKLD
jgi:hypothetical protein